MALVTYKDLCIDANDAGTLGTFWAAALGLELHRHDDGDAHLSGPTSAHTIWVNQVPEPKAAKHRMHLDVNTRSVEELERLGATVLDAESFRWTLMADPEGGEFCAFVREGEITRPLYEIVVDTGESHEHSVRIATWWADLLGARVGDSGRDFAYVGDIAGAPFEWLVFGSVPEPKTVKNRLHIDVSTSDLDALLDAGAEMLRPRDEEIGWSVLADPDGNEFCVFAPE
jgi:hypothetical protein